MKRSTKRIVVIGSGLLGVALVGWHVAAYIWSWRPWAQAAGQRVWVGYWGEVAAPDGPRADGGLSSRPDDAAPQQDPSPSLPEVVQANPTVVQAPSIIEAGTAPLVTSIQPAGGAGEDSDPVSSMLDALAGGVESYSRNQSSGLVSPASAGEARMVTYYAGYAQRNKVGTIATARHSWRLRQAMKNGWYPAAVRVDDTSKFFPLLARTTWKKDLAALQGLERVP